MNYSEDVIWYWFTNIPGVGRITRNRLLERFGSPVQLYHASEKTINNNNSIVLTTDTTSSHNMQIRRYLTILLLT